jgi:choline dehydrogenase
MQNLSGIYRRESSSTAHLGSSIVTPQGQGVGGRKLWIFSESIVSRLIFHDSRKTTVIGVEYFTLNQSYVVYANEEVIVSAGVYGSPTLLMRSGVGNCTQLSQLGINCVFNSPYVGTNLQDHLRVQLAIRVPFQFFYDLLLAFPGEVFPLNTDGHFLEGRIFTAFANLYTDYNVSNVTQPDTKFTALITSNLPYPELETLYNLIWLDDPPLQTPIFELAPVLLRPKCTGSVQLASTNPGAYPLILSNYLCHPDDLNWATRMFQDLANITNLLMANNSAFQAVFPTLDMINNTASLQRLVTAISTSYRHPAGSCRMGDLNTDRRGVVDGNLCVHGLKGVRVVDASVFPSIPSANLQASVYALSSNAYRLITSGCNRCD